MFLVLHLHSTSSNFNFSNDAKHKIDWKHDIVFTFADTQNLLDFFYYSIGVRDRKLKFTIIFASWYIVIYQSLFIIPSLNH